MHKLRRISSVSCSATKPTCRLNHVCPCPLLPSCCSHVSPLLPRAALTNHALSPSPFCHLRNVHYPSFFLIFKFSHIKNIYIPPWPSLPLYLLLLSFLKLNYSKKLLSLTVSVPFRRPQHPLIWLVPPHAEVPLQFLMTYVWTNVMGQFQSSSLLTCQQRSPLLNDPLTDTLSSWDLPLSWCSLASLAHFPPFMLAFLKALSQDLPFSLYFIFSPARNLEVTCDSIFLLTASKSNPLGSPVDSVFKTCPRSDDFTPPPNLSHLLFTTKMVS